MGFKIKCNRTVDIIIVKLGFNGASNSPVVPNSIVLYDLASMWSLNQQLPYVPIQLEINGALLYTYKNHLLRLQWQQIDCTVILNNVVRSLDWTINALIESNHRWQLDKEQRAELFEVLWLCQQHNIPRDILNHIDDYISMDLLSKYDLELPVSLTRVENHAVYIPTSLQRQKWDISDSSFAFTPRPKLKYTYRTSLLDKLKMYITLQYYQAIDEQLPECNTMSCNDMHRAYLMDVCGCDTIDEWESVYKDYYAVQNSN